MHCASSHDDPMDIPVGHAAPEGIVTIDEAMRIVMVNPAAQRMFGQTAPQLLGRELSVLIPAGLHEAHAGHVRQFMASGVPERPMLDRGLLSGLRADGEAFALEATVCRLDVGGELGGKRYYTALLREVGDAQQWAAKIELINRRMRSLFDLLPVAIWVTEGDRVVYANGVCARLFGVPEREQLTGRSLYEFLDPQVHGQVRDKVAQALAAQEEPLPLHASIARPDGSSREVEMVVAALPDHARTLVQMVISDVTRQAQERRELLGLQKLLRNLNASVVDAREEERRSIARELHDELGQRLMVLKLGLESLDPSGAPCIPRERMQSMIEMVDDTVAAMRRIAMDLRPLMLDDLGLKAAIEWLAHEFERRAGLQVVLHLDLLPERMPQKVLITLYRIVQEALTNVVRHSGADHAEITLALRGTVVELLVDDNGKGFSDPAGQAPGGSFGLIGIRERVHMLGGQLRIGNRPGGGAQLVVRLPLADGDEDMRPPADDGDAGAAP